MLHYNSNENNSFKLKSLLKRLVYYTRECSSNLLFDIVLLIASLIGPVFFIASLASQAKSFFALFNSIFLMALFIIRILYRYKMSHKQALVYNMAVVVGFGLTIPSFFLAVGPVVQKNNIRLVDHALLQIDEALLGWIFPKGQISLYLDQSKNLNPSTGFGRFYTEVLQLFYFSYYLWGYLVLVILTYRYVKAYRNPKKYNVGEQLSKIKLYISGWMFAYYLTFLINLTFPAQSPRLYIKDLFQHKLEGFGLAKFLMNISKDDSSFGSFPSGHVSESLVVGVYSLRINFWFGIVVIISSIMIAIATQILRYHYFIDLVAAILLVFLSSVYGHFLTQDVHDVEIKKAIAVYEDNEDKLVLNDLEEGALSELEDFDEKNESSSIGFGRNVRKHKSFIF